MPPQSNPAQVLQGPYIRWIPVQIQPCQNAMGSTERSHAENRGPGGGSTFATEPNPGSGPGWPYPNQNGSSPTVLLYPGFGSGYFPFAVTSGGRPQPGMFYIRAPLTGPELRLISQLLSGLQNYSVWSRELRLALVTKDKEAFIDGTIPVSADERLARHWRKCNQLLRT